MELKICLEIKLQVETKWEDHPGLQKILDVIEMLLEESGLESSNLFGFGSVVDSNNDGYWG